MPTWLKVVLGLIIGFVGFAGAIVGLAFWLTTGILEPIERQIAALQAGNISAAYEETSDAFRQATPIGNFAAFVEGNPSLKDIASYSFPSRSFENDTGKAEGTLTSSTGGVMPITYDLVKERSLWKVLHIQLGTAGDGATP